MEKGQLRCDANISVRLKGQEEFGTRAEVKNVNSFRFVKMAIEYEIARQVAIVDAGGTIVQETRLFNNTTGETSSMRSKEEAHDYRYFPEPDLPPLIVEDAWLTKIRDAMPELPPAKRKRFVEDYGISEYDATVLDCFEGDIRLLRNRGDGQPRRQDDCEVCARRLGWRSQRG